MCIHTPSRIAQQHSIVGSAAAAGGGGGNLTLILSPQNNALTTTNNRYVVINNNNLNWMSAAHFSFIMNSPLLSTIRQIESGTDHYTKKGG